ncbi:MAG TPA: amidohydrolase family protein [Gemmatimonadales bacterium]|nr:amidohydrolase family protein [Gemmatimonadales bacterium]
MLRLRAGTVHPVTAPPISDGAVLVDGGRIVAVGPASRILSPAGAGNLEFPEAELVPGLVNCHTHLELTHLAGRNGEPDFARWIRRVRELKDETPAPEFRRAAEAGIRDGWSRGVTTFADTGSTGAPLEAMAALDARGIYYQEVFGPDPAQCDAGLADMDQALARLRPLASAPLRRLGVSPHAPYTVSAPLYRAVALRARAAELPIAVHLAESREETEFVRDGTGPFAEALARRGIEVAAQRRSPVQYLLQLGVIRRGTLCIHCVQVDQADVASLALAGAAVAHCPRSNAAHGHGSAPLASLRGAGVRVGLGTDSAASVGDVELRAEAAHAGLAGADALRMLTLEGARALDWDEEIGSIEAGKAADLAVFPAGGWAGAARGPALLTVLAGRVVHRGEAAAPHK